MSNTKIFLLVGLQIATTFFISIAFSFLTDYLVSINFLNDLPCKQAYGCGFWGGETNWSLRHYIWFWMGFILFVLQIIRIGVWINDTIESRSNK